MAAASSSRVKCKYWEKCYRTDEDHKKQYLHPDRSADSGKGDASPKKGADNKPGISLKGKTVVFTGILASGTRKQATARAQAAGLIVKPTVSKVTDIIVVGEQPGKKIDLAEDKGVAVLTEEEWEELLCQSKPSKTAIGSPGKKGGACSNNSGDEDSDRPSQKKRQKLNVQQAAAPHKVSDSDSEPDDERSQPSHGMTLRRQRTHNLSDSEDEGIADISPVKRRRSASKPDATDSKSKDTSPSPNKAKASPNKGNVNPASPNKGKAPRCKYWENCYRKDPAHLKAFHHPPKKDAADPGEGTSASGSGSDKSTTPKHSMDVGETVDVGAYRVKRVTDHYYCTCMGWKTQPGPVNMRTCKHLKEYLGEEFENNRCKGSLGTGGARSPQKSKCSIADPQLLLAQKWDEKLDPTGWWMSEKLDGVRAYWNGKGFYSRLGNAFYSPPWFTQGFPTDMTLDGELFGGRGKFQSTVSIVKTADSPQWKQLTYKVFDIPSSGNSPFEKRTEKLKKFTEDNSLPYVSIVEQTKCKGKADLKNELERVIGLGGEGVMIRQPNSQYEHRRSHTLLKFKKFYDAEARVIGHEPGKGRNSGRCGALRCEMACGKKFSCGSGLSDQDRNKPPKIGSIITYKFQEYTNDGVPRFPTYIGPRIDLNKPSDADVPAKPTDD